MMHTYIINSGENCPWKLSRVFDEPKLFTLKVRNTECPCFENQSENSSRKSVKFKPIQAHYDSFWLILTQFDSIWFNQTQLDSFWLIMIHFDTFWFILIHFDSTWLLLTLLDLEWRKLSLKTFKSFRRTQIIYAKGQKYWMSLFWEPIGEF